MARVFTVPERMRAGALNLDILGKYEVMDSDGNWRDVSSLGGLDWFNTAVVSDGIGQNAASITVTLLREAAVIPPENFQIGHWAFDGDSTDSSGNALNGTPAGTPTFVTGTIGQAISLNGTTQSVGVSSMPTGPLIGISIRAIISATSFSSLRTIASWMGQQIPLGYHWFYVNAGQLGFQFTDGTALRTINTTGANLSTGVTYDVAVAHDYAAKVLTFYVNGAVYSTHSLAAFGPPVPIASAQLWRMGLSCDGTGFFAGTIDDVRLYGYALSSSEAVTLHNWTGTKSVAPFVTASTINRNLAGSYAPILDLGRQQRVSAAIVNKGDTPRTRLNSILWSRDITHWTANGGATAAFNAQGLDGLPNTASTVTDSVGTSAFYTSATVTVPVDSNTHTIAFWVWKDGVTSRFPLLYAQISGGTTVSRGVWLNTSTGAPVVSNNVGTGTSRVVDGASIAPYYANWWVVEITLTNNSTAGNVNLAAEIDPARGSVIGTQAAAATGSIIVGNVEVGIAQPSFSKLPVYTNASTATVNDWKELVTGYIDAIDWGGKGRSLVTVTGRDLSARLLDTYISVRRAYGASTGTAIETVLAQYLTDNVSSPPSITVTPSSPGFLIFTETQDYANLMDAMNEKVVQTAYILRYRYNSSDQLVLTLYKPDRTLANGVSFVIGPEEYLDIPGLKIAIDGIRTYIELRYIEATTGQLTLVTSPSSFTSAAITKYGKRYMAIDEQNGSQINSLSAAQSMVDAVCSDLQDPGVEHQLESFLLWWVQLSDYVQFNPNTILYDQPQFGAITGYTHTLSNGTGKTTLLTRGKPAGGYRSWLSYAKALGGEYIAPRIVPAPSAFQIASEDGAFGYLNFVFDDPQRNVANYRITTIAGRSTAVTGSPTTPAATGTNLASVALVDKLASYIDVDWYGVDSDGTSGALLGHMRFTFGLGARPLPPDVAYTTIPDSTFPNGGILSGAASIDNDTVNVRWVASKVGKPSAADVNAASPIAVGAGSTSVTIGTMLTGLNTGDRYWIAVRCYNSAGLESDLTEITDVYVAGSPAAVASVVLQSTTPSSSAIKFTVTPNNHCAEFEIYVKEYDGSNTDPGAAVAVDAGYPTPLDAIVVGADATKYRAQPGVNYDIVVPIAGGTNWILITIVPYDAIARQGLKLNAKGRGNGTAPPSPPISTTIDASPTATSITNKVTLATPINIYYVKVYRDNVWTGVLFDVHTQANGALVTLPADTGLTPNTTYLYTYSGVDITGIESVGRTSPVSVTTAASATIPTPTLASAAYNPATETWSFVVTPGGSTPAGVTWHVERATTSGGTYTLRSACDNTSTSLSESDPMDTTTGTDYYFKCYGTLAGWTTSVHSSFVGPIHKTGTGEPATAPSIGVITNPTSHHLVVTWTNPSDTIDSIHVEVEGFQSGVWGSMGAANVAAASTSSGSIAVSTIGINYRGRARYYNAVRNGPWSSYTSVIGPII